MVVGVQTDDGTFQRKHYDEIETDIEEKARDEFGDDVDLSQGSPIKQLLDVSSLEDERLWQVLEHLYYSAYYEDAFGAQLDKILSLANIERRPRQGASGVVVFRVNQPNADTVTIPQGTRVTTHETTARPAIPFKTLDVGTLQTGTTSTDRIPIRALEPWETDLAAEWLGNQTNVAADTITRMPSPVAGVDSVSNPYPTGATNENIGFDFVSGRDPETDAQLRQRWENSLGSDGKASLNAIRAAVRSVPTVEDVAIEENTSMVDETGTGGLPPKSFRVTVLGGGNNEVAHAIMDTRAAGIESYGDTSGQSTTNDGVTRTEYFDRADRVGIFVHADLYVGEEFPENGNLLVENAIIEYIGGETVEGDQYIGLGMGENVVYDQVFKRAVNVQGVNRLDLTYGTVAPPASTADELEIGEKEAAETGGGSITVTNDGS